MNRKGQPEEKAQREQTLAEALPEGKRRTAGRAPRRLPILSGAALLLAALTLTACGSKEAPGAGTETSLAGEENLGEENSSGKEAAAGEEALSVGESSGGDSEAATEAAGEEEGETQETETAGEKGEHAGELSLQDYLKKDGGLDLDALQKINPDIYGWLEIADTGLSFPLLQSSQDEYFYLSHDVYGEQDDAGCIYTEYFNRKDFSDPNTVIYGRNVEGRFGGLHQYQDRDFFDSHRQINIYLGDRKLTWKIFAAYTYDDRHLIKIYDFWDKDIFDAYLKDVFSIRAMDAYLDDSMEVTAEDQILTLSTGVTGQDDKRYLVQAKLQ